MNRIKKLVAVALSTVTAASVGVVSGAVSAGASGTGAGLAEYALNAYYEGWSYVWGGTSPGAVDCSGLIWSYCGGDRLEMLADAQANGRDWGYVSSGIPRVHGLGLSRPGHVGVYIEDGMEVDARGSDYGVCYQQIGENGWNNWDCWFKLTAVTYPENGWENFNGNYYYYENGEYVVDTTRTIDGTTYYFDAKGHSGTTPSNTSSASTNSGSSSKSDSKKSQPTMWSKGSNDDEVVKIQTRLAELGYYDGPLDGDFGDMTDKAFRAFQKAAGLTVDGIAGADREVLYSDNAPAAKQEKTEKTTEAPTEPATEAETQPETEPETVPETEPETEPAETTAETEPVAEQTEEESGDLVIVAQNGDFNEQVSGIQQKLSELGYYALDTAGVYGDYTEEAVLNFQIANGLDATGKVDAKTYEVLFSDDAIESAIPAVGAQLKEEEEPVAAKAPEEEVAAEAAIPIVISIDADEEDSAEADDRYEEPVAAAAPVQPVAQPEPEPEVEVEPETEAVVEEAPVAVVEQVEEVPAVMAVEPTQPATISAPKKTPAAVTTTKPAVTNPSTAASTAAKANAATARALEKASGAATAAKTADVTPSTHLWLWLLVAAAVLGVVAFVLLLSSRKQAARTANKTNVHDRW